MQVRKHALRHRQNNHVEKASTFGCEIKSTGHAIGCIDPVYCPLTVCILVIIQHPVCVGARVPVLSESKLRRVLIQTLNVLGDEVPTWSPPATQPRPSCNFLPGLHTRSHTSKNLL